MKKKITFQQITRLVSLSKKPLENKYLENLQEKHFGNFRHNYYRFLYHLVKFKKPKLSLEIGVDQGIASAHMCAAAKEYGGWVVGIDINRPTEEICLIDNFIFVNEDSTKVRIHNYDFPNAKFGVVFQDSSHRYDQSVKEWNNFTDPDLLDKDAIWVCDDITSAHYQPKIDQKSMVEYFNERPGRKKLYKDLHYETVMGVILL